MGTSDREETLSPGPTQFKSVFLKPFVLPADEAITTVGTQILLVLVLTVGDLGTRLGYNV